MYLVVGLQIKLIKQPWYVRIAFGTSSRSAQRHVAIDESLWYWLRYRAKDNRMVGEIIYLRGLVKQRQANK